MQRGLIISKSRTKYNKKIKIGSTLSVLNEEGFVDQHNKDRQKEIFTVASFCNSNIIILVFPYWEAICSGV